MTFACGTALPPPAGRTTCPSAIDQAVGTEKEDHRPQRKQQRSQHHPLRNVEPSTPVFRSAYSAAACAAGQRERHKQRVSALRTAAEVDASLRWCPVGRKVSLTWPARNNREEKEGANGERNQGGRAVSFLLGPVRQVNRNMKLSSAPKSCMPKMTQADSRFRDNGFIISGGRPLGCGED